MFLESRDAEDWSKGCWIFSFHMKILHSKKCWVVSTLIWVKYEQTHVGLKMQLKHVQLKVKVEVGLIWNYIFNPRFRFVHILPKFGFKQPSIV